MKVEKRIISVNGMEAKLGIYLLENLESADPNLKRPMVVI